ncbi:MAG: glycosidase [Saprospiraceae bacterium]|nr:glycosidase [Saprospiraceae bacterium]
MKVKNPITYEINTRSWIKQFGAHAKLTDVPTEYWRDLRSKGVDLVWLMGVWETTKSSIEKYCFHPDLVKAYDRISPEWTKDDIYGSPYAIEDYQVSSHLGKNEDLGGIRSVLHENNMGLILDFIPNHFNAESSLIHKHPDVFLQASKEQFERDSFTIYQSRDRYFAHGKDPYFPAWTDTVQINYSVQEAHLFMTERLHMLSEFCDGVRCDMAMLILPEIFEKTWHDLSHLNAPEAFWKTVIPTIKEQNPEFIFIAEAYWDTQWQLQQMGFDYTYDKKLMDLLRSRSNHDIKAHLSGDLTYQEKSVRFIENHDEDRSLLELGEGRSRMASVMMSTLPGMKLFYDGQWEGRRMRIPVQMGTSFPEDPCPCTVNPANADHIPCPCQYHHYNVLLPVIQNEILKNGSWEWYHLEGAPEAIFSWQWTHRHERLLVVINTEPHFNQVKLSIALQENTAISEVLNNNGALVNDHREGQITVALPGYKSVIYHIKNRR